jgi:two-component system CheB/CheR fusion protein
VAEESEVSKALVGIRILVVDGHPDARVLLESVLAYCGAFVTTVGSAGDALDHVQGAPFDVVVADVGLPDDGSYRLVRDAGAHVPFLALAAESEDGPDRTLAAGFQGHLRKPVDPWELCRVVAELARKA